MGESLRVPIAAEGSKELRLALVCYGGVSLAIYMHGVTKEIHKLVAASRAFEQDPARNPFGESDSEHAYWNALREVASRDNVRTRVAVDIISGTSAGGINGVFLAKALAHDLSQDALRNLWMTRGDVKQLIDAPGFVPGPLKVAWFLAKVLLRRGKVTPPLRGDRMSRWLYAALQEMDGTRPEGSGTGSLMPDGLALDLFVTATDFYGYGRWIPLAYPAGIVDRWHRLALRFRRDPRQSVDQFASDTHNAGLAFAARATSSFPGAFPPISIARFQEDLGGAKVDWSAFESGLFRTYQLAGADPRRTYFVDGGVLDNFPFGHAIKAMQTKPADRQVQRRLVYIQPDPGVEASPAAPEEVREPSVLRSAWAALSTIPRREPIVDDLLEVREMNARVKQLREVIETNFTAIRAHVEEIEKRAGGFSSDPTAEQIQAWQEQMHAAARALSAFAYSTYVRIKIHGVVAGFAAGASSICAYPEESNQAFFVQDLVHRWAEGQGLFEREGSPTPGQVAFLSAFDLPYRVRRLRFLIAGVNWLYDGLGKNEPPRPAREELDGAKTLLYSAVEFLEGIISGKDISDELRREVASCFDAQRLEQSWTGGGQRVEDYEEELARLGNGLATYLDQRMAGLGARVYQEFREIAARWQPNIRRDLLVRYLAYPFWDVVVYPIHAMVGVTERDHVDVVRISPDDASMLEDGGTRKKLKGVALGHFGAFFRRAWRESDYLWGRLDGAELLMRLLLGDPKSPHTQAAFRAIVRDERSSLRQADEVFEKVERAIAERA